MNDSCNSLCGIQYSHELPSKRHKGSHRTFLPNVRYTDPELLEQGEEEKDKKTGILEQDDHKCQVGLAVETPLQYSSQIVELYALQCLSLIHI